VCIYSRGVHILGVRSCIIGPCNTQDRQGVNSRCESILGVYIFCVCICVDSRCSRAFIIGPSPTSDRFWEVVNLRCVYILGECVHIYSRCARAYMMTQISIGSVLELCAYVNFRCVRILGV